MFLDYYYRLKNKTGKDGEALIKWCKHRAKIRNKYANKIKNYTIHLITKIYNKLELSDKIKLTEFIKIMFNKVYYNSKEHIKLLELKVLDYYNNSENVKKLLKGD